MKLRRAAIAATAAALLTLTACGTSEPLDEDSDDSTSQSDTSSDADTEDSDADSDTDTGAETVGLTEETFAEAVTDAQIEAGTATMEGTGTFGADEVAFTGQVDTGESLSDTAMSMQMELPGMGSMDMILLDNKFYLNFGEMTQDKYLVVDLNDPQGLGALMGSLGQLNFAEQTEALEGAMEGFETGRTETMDGVETTEYVVTVDTAKLYEQMDGPLAEMDVDSLGLPETLDYSFWVGADNLPRRMSMDLGPTGSMEINISGWGEPVDISAPAPNQITKKDPFSMPG